MYKFTERAEKAIKLSEDIAREFSHNYVGTERAVNNYDHKYRGLTTIREGIRDSINIVTAKTMEKVTPAVAYEYLLNLGFTTLVEKESDSKGNVYSDIQQTLCR